MQLLSHSHYSVARCPSYDQSERDREREGDGERERERQREGWGNTRKVVVKVNLFVYCLKFLSSSMLLGHN